jgi:hypothetical protein
MERIRASYVGPIVAGAPGYLDFGCTGTGWSTRSTLNVSNVGTEDLVITLYADMPFYVVGSVSGIHISPGASIDVDIEFAPTEPGEVEASLRIDSNANALQRNLSGRAILGHSDCTNNGVWDLEDAGLLAECLRGPRVPIAPECQCIDLENLGDEGAHDVDLEDVASFLRAFECP